ncbi:MAG TPA: hypothetical protein DIU00_02265 [Phycisphaerales bacterium]|nr:hypothetical protein [Phycisphaerales bacterium]
MRSEKTKATSILVVLLIYAFMAGNTSGDLALCIGANGHIALEPVIHEHCHNHPHIEKDDPSSMGHEHDGHLESPHCKPCIDIPIFIGPTDNRVPIKPAKPNQNTLICLLEPAAISDYQFILPAIPRRSYSTSDENRFLRSIILLV